MSFNQFTTCRFVMKLQYDINKESYTMREIVGQLPCAAPENYFRGVQPRQSFFLVDEGREDPKTTISGQSSARKRNDVSLAC